MDQQMQSTLLADAEFPAEFDREPHELGVWCGMTVPRLSADDFDSSSVAFQRGVESLLDRHALHHDRILAVQGASIGPDGETYGVIIDLTDGA